MGQLPAETLANHGDASRSKRKGASYISWLEKDQSYSPQPYEHLAAALHKVGEPSVATDVLYAGRERARHEARRVSWRALRLDELAQVDYEL